MESELPVLTTDAKFGCLEVLVTDFGMDSSSILMDSKCGLISRSIKNGKINLRKGDQN